MALASGVQLAGQRPASQILHRILLAAAQQFPTSLADARVPESAVTFRKTYTDVVPQFEAARLNSSDRVAIAAMLSEQCQQHLVFVTDKDECPLHEHLANPAPPLTLRSSQGNRSAARWLPNPEYLGRAWQGSMLAELGSVLAERGVVTGSAAQAIRWLNQHEMDTTGIDLSDRRIVVLGGNAEMAPTRHFLEAGATVLWIDQARPPDSLSANGAFAGSLHWTDEPADILAEPGRVLATILAFAAGQPVDMCLYAYAPGQARELRLTGAMNALVNVMPADLIASVTMLVSPTTPAGLDAEDLLQMKAKRDSRPAWQSLWDKLGFFGKGGGTMTSGSIACPRTVVSIQGASYQAAQYLAKVAMAECWARHGQLHASLPTPLRVSANTAAITSTRSLEHPVFAAAFGGAAAFQIETFTPALSRQINGLLTVHDWLNPTLPIPGDLRVHGGIHTLPYPLESALKTAAAIGFVKSPRLLLGLVGF